MYYKLPTTFRKLEPRKCKTYKLRNLLNLLRIFNCRNNLFYVCFLIMSLVIVKATAITIYQNRTPTENISKTNQTFSQFQATTSEFINTNHKTRYPTELYLEPQKSNLTITNHIIRTNIIVGGGGGERGELKENFKQPIKENMRAKLQQLLQRENNDDDEEKKQLQQDLQQQQQEQQYQQLLQQQQHQQSQHAILASENAYLLERIDAGGGSVGGGGGGGGNGRGIAGSMHEQPIYGTWSAKARRPKAPLSAAATTTTTSTTGALVPQSSSLQTLMGEVDNDSYYDQHHLNHQQNHHYERLPKRSSTMTPVRRELHDQIPRPPRLTSRQPSLAIRRQFTDTPMPNGSFRDESRPKPFHFPFDGPMPEEFKKLQQQSERGGTRTGQQNPNEDVNNIQDILHRLNLGGGPTKLPPLMMMPTGLHISGSFKNLKSSGIANFFRGKRNKKQMQLQFPMPMQMLNSYPQPILGLMPQPYQQRIAMEQIYPFKPRSPNDINLLAMHHQQQQQQQQQLKQQHSKGKKQTKKQKDKKNAIASSNLMLQQYPYATAATDLLYPSLYPPFMAVNVTQAPPTAQLSKRVPFKVNLDIFPVMPPSKHHKQQPLLAMDEARIVSSMRPPTALRNPFVEYFSTPLTPTASSFNYYNPYQAKQPQYNPIRFPTGSQNPLLAMAQSSNMQLTYPEQMQKYLQQQQQQQQQQHLYANFLNTQGHQTPFLPIDCDQPIPASAASSLSTTNSKTNPIMVHLNVFPKQKSSSPISTNPFYNNVPQHIQRNTIQEESESSLSPIEPRYKGRSLNETTYQKIARSDSNEDNMQQQQQMQHHQRQQQQQLEQDLVDFDHPIVAASNDDEDTEDTENTAQLPLPSALQALKPNISSESSQSFYYDSRPNATMLSTLNNNNNTNYNVNLNSSLEQMASDAKTASLFRFPVEDLIQFQVHDAM